MGGLGGDQHILATKQLKLHAERTAKGISPISSIRPPSPGGVEMSSFRPAGGVAAMEWGPTLKNIFIYIFKSLKENLFSVRKIIKKQ